MKELIRMPITLRGSLFCCMAAFAAPAGLDAQTTSGLAIETNRFYTSQGRALVEGAVEIPYPLLTFAPEGEMLRSRARVEVMIDREDGSEVFRTEREITPEAMNEAMAASERVSSMETFAVYAPPGAYVTRARVTDVESGRTFEVSEPLDVPESQPLISDVLLSNHVKKDVRLQEGAYMPYLIGTTMFNPSPRSVFHKDAPLVYFYYEVNPEVAGASAPLEAVSLAMRIRGADGQEVKDLGTRAIQVSQDRNFDLGAFNIAGLPPGRYALEVACETCPEPVTRSSAFEVRSPPPALAFLQDETADPAGDPADPGGDADLRYYADLSAAQVDSVIDALDVFLTVNQEQLLETLNAGGKVRFLNRFWDSVDSNPQTEINEDKQEFERRIAYADQFFGSINRTGRDTDRGRIYVLFGPPTERIDRPVEATIGPYEIWNYANQGETFAFADFSKNGNYRMIYSTDDDFVGDPQIQNLVDTDTGTSSPTFLRTSRGYEQIILDIRENRVRRGNAQ